MADVTVAIEKCEIASRTIRELTSEGCIYAACLSPINSQSIPGTYSWNANPVERGNYLWILHIENDFILVGGRKALYNLSVADLSINSQYEWLANSSDVRYCDRYEIIRAEICIDEVFVSAAYKISYYQYVICASAARVIRCKYYELDEYSTWSLTSEYSKNAGLLTSIYPYARGNIKLLTSEGQLYTINIRIKGRAHHAVNLFRNGTETYIPGKVNGLTTPHSHYWFFNYVYTESIIVHASPVDMFDSPSYVYITFTEPALHHVDLNNQIYSKIGRVCKTDRGYSQDPFTEIEKSRVFQFATFFKKRLLCREKLNNSRDIFYWGHQQHLPHPIARFPLTFDDMVATSQPRNTSFTAHPVMFAAFNTQKHLSRGWAICLYNLTDIEQAFTDIYSSGTPYTCPSDTKNLTQIELERALNNSLEGEIHPIDEQPLFLSNNSYFRVTQLLIDYHVKDANDELYDVIFISTNDGQVLKLVKFKKGRNSEDRYHIIEQRQVFKEKEAILEMKFINNGRDGKALLLNTNDKMKRIAVYQCHIYSTCSACLEVRDPYCSWSESTSTCVPTNSTNSHDLVQNIKRGGLSCHLKKCNFKTGTYNYTKYKGTCFGLVNSFYQASGQVYHIEEDKLTHGNIVLLDEKSLASTNSINTTVLLTNITSDDAYVHFTQLTPSTIILVNKKQHCLQLLDRSTSSVTPYAGTCGVQGNITEACTSTLLSNPVSIALDSTINNKLYIAERSPCLKMLNMDSGVIVTILTDNRLLQSTSLSYNGDMLTITTDSAIFTVHPSSNKEMLYVLSGSVATGFLDSNFSAALYSAPRELLQLTNQLILVADSSNDQIRILDTENRVVSSLCSGEGVFYGGTRVECSIPSPHTLLFIGGVLYVGAKSIIASFLVKESGYCFLKDEWVDPDDVKYRVVTESGALQTPGIYTYAASQVEEPCLQTVTLTIVDTNSSSLREDNCERHVTNATYGEAIHVQVLPGIFEYAHAGQYYIVTKDAVCLTYINISLLKTTSTTSTSTTSTSTTTRSTTSETTRTTLVTADTTLASSTTALPTIAITEQTSKAADNPTGIGTDTPPQAIVLQTEIENSSGSALFMGELERVVVNLLPTLFILVVITVL